VSEERLHFGSGARLPNAMEVAEHYVRYATARGFVRDRRVLDIACGEGYGSWLMKEWGAREVVGVDISEDALATARATFSRAGVTFVRVDAADESLRTLGPEPFDLIICLETIEHVREPSALLAGLQRLLRPGGTLIISCPNDHVTTAPGEANPFHIRKYTLDEFKLLTESVLGAADGWYYGTNLQGYAIAASGLELAEAEWRDPKSILLTAPADAAFIVPSQVNIRPSPSSVLFYVGIWGRDKLAAPVCAVSLQSYPSFAEPWRALDWFKAERERMVADAKATAAELNALATALAERETRIDALEAVLDRELTPIVPDAASLGTCSPDQASAQPRTDAEVLRLQIALAEVQRLRHKVLAQANDLADRNETVTRLEAAKQRLESEIAVTAQRMEAQFESALLLKERELESTTRLLEDKIDAASTEAAHLKSRCESESLRSNDLQARLDLAYGALKELEARCETESQRSRDLLAALAAETDTREAYRREIEAIYRSRSWRISRPLRAASDRLRGIPLAVRMVRSLRSVLRRIRSLRAGLVASESRTPVQVATGTLAPEPAVAQPEPPRITSPATETSNREAEERALAALITATSSHCSRFGRLTHAFALPFLANGGAEQTLAAICRSLGSAAPGTSQILFLTDLRIPATPAELPDTVLVVDLLELLPGSSMEQRQRFLTISLRALRPRVFHCINSDIGWRTIIEHGAVFRHSMKLVGSVFAFQFAPQTGERIGYAATYLAAAYPQLHYLLSDNRRFVTDAATVYGLPDSEQKCRVIYNVPRNFSQALVEVSRRRLSAIESGARPTTPLKVLWAGRLDEEKRIDLLPQIADACPRFEFHVFGKPVVGDRPDFDHVPSNLLLRGGFASPEQMFAEEFDVFIFTSRWEGLPNVLLEVALHGVPCVAPTVGGVGEVISEDTGFPLSERPDAADYQRALLRIDQDRPEAARRAMRLLALVSTRHSKEQFERSLADIDGYVQG